MSTTLANDVRNQCRVIRDNSEGSRGEGFKPTVVFIPSPDGRFLTYIVLLQQAVEGRQVLDYELAKNPLVRLDAQQSR